METCHPVHFQASSTKQESCLRSEKSTLISERSLSWVRLCYFADWTSVHSQLCHAVSVFWNHFKCGATVLIQIRTVWATFLCFTHFEYNSLRLIKKLWDCSWIWQFFVSLTPTPALIKQIFQLSAIDWRLVQGASCLSDSWDRWPWIGKVRENGWMDISAIVAYSII